jgi:hypothetical protein
MRPAPGQRPSTEQTGVEDKGGRGRKDAAIEYRQRALESAQESARSNNGHQRVYSNGDSYYGREIQDAQRALDREKSGK